MELNKTQKTAAMIAAAVVGTVAFVGGLKLINVIKEEPVDPNWTLVSDADDGGKWYVDQSTFEYESGRYTGGWIMLSQAKADKDGVRSVKFKTIFDCQNRQYRMMQGSETDGPNGRGKGVGILEAGPTRDLPPGTNIANVADFVCQPLYTNQPSSDQHEHEQSRSDNLKQI